MSDYDDKIEISKCWSKLFNIESKLMDLEKTISELTIRLSVLEKLPLRSYTKEESDSIFISKMQAEQKRP